MAIINEIPGLEVRIFVRGQAVMEYDDDEAKMIGNGEQKSMTKYIEAVDDEEFKVLCSFDSNFKHKDNDFEVAIYVDGRHMASVLKRGLELQNDGLVTIDAHSFNEGDQWYEKKFCFSKLSIVENQTLQHTKRTLSALRKTGIVSVQFCRVKWIRNARSQYLDEQEIDGFGDIAEKALKGQAISHAIGLKRKESTKRVNVMQCTSIDAYNRPLLAYNFKYRSRDALQGLRVIPRSPSPVPLEERDVATLNLDELRELARRQQERLAAREVKHEVKRERNTEDDDDANGEDGITIGEVRPVKRRVLDTIDLTDD